MPGENPILTRCCSVKMAGRASTGKRSVCGGSAAYVAVGFPVFEVLLLAQRRPSPTLYIDSREDQQSQYEIAAGDEHGEAVVSTG